MLTLAKAGKYNGYLLEGMACPGGCVGGAGVLSDAKRAEIKLKQEMANSQLKNSSETYYVDYLKLITEEDVINNYHVILYIILIQFLFYILIILTKMCIINYMMKG